MRWAIKHKSGRALFVTSDEFIANNRRKMGWIVEEVMSKCPKCNNTGMVDSGGVQPCGEPILIECDCVVEEAKITSRKQFETSWLKRGGETSDLVRYPENHHGAGGDNVGGQYVIDDVQGHWQTWQASRAAIEINLSNMHLLLCDQNDVIYELTKHNLKVKK